MGRAERRERSGLCAVIQDSLEELADKMRAAGATDDEVVRACASICSAIELGFFQAAYEVAEQLRAEFRDRKLVTE